MKKRYLASCVLLALSLNSLALAQESDPLLQEEDFEDSFDDEFDDEFGDFYGSDEFISISTGTQKAISKAPSVAAVITSKDILKLGANTVHEVIETVTGIHVYPSNLNRMVPNYSIRGIHTQENPQVLVLVNGIRTTQHYNGAKWLLFNTGVEIIDRIEVIKGPGSAVHGADAFSGVINIVTKGEAGAYANDAGVRGGSFGTASAWVNYAFDFGENKSLSFNAQWTDTDGDDSRIIQEDALHGFGLGFLSNAPGPLDTRKETKDIHLTLNIGNLKASYWYLNNFGGTGSGAAQALSNSDWHDDTASTFKLNYNDKLSDELDYSISAFYQEHEEETFFVIFPPNFALPSGSESGLTFFTEGLIGNPGLNEENLGAELVLNYNPNSDHNIRVGLGFHQTDGETQERKNFGPLAQTGTEETRDGQLTDVTGTPFVFGPDVSRDVWYITLQDEWKIAKDWELTAGIRYDDYSDFGSTINPRAALVWQAKHNLTAKALYGRAFRAPSFGELFFTNNPISLGNPELDPEKINTFEVAFDYRPSFDWKILFNLFSYEADNLIVFVPQEDGSSVAANAGAQDAYGAELEVHWNPTEDVELKIGYAIQDSENADTKQDIADAPRSSLDLTLNWKVNDALHWHIDSTWINDRARLTSDPRPDISDYNWVNSNLSYSFNSKLNFSLSIRNLFDENAREPSDGQIAEDFPLEERGYWVTTRYTF